MLKSKKMVSLFLTVVMALTFGCVSAFAEEESTVAMQIGDITEYSLYVVQEVVAP